MSRVPPSHFPSKRVDFNKPWLSYKDQLLLLESRGLLVDDRNAAESFLAHVNYYRLSGYFSAFESSKHQFIVGTTFRAIQGAYEYDLQIRDLLTEALEIVEVDMRTNMAHRFGEKHGPYGHTQSASFHWQPSRHKEWIERVREEAKRSKELFVRHFKNRYTRFPDLPVWVATEVMSFGMLSMMFSGMLRDDQSIVAARYGFKPETIQDWLHHLSYVRNLCAHHARVWNREWSIKPKIPNIDGWNQFRDNGRLACTLLILYRLLLRCTGIGDFTSEWKGRVDYQLAFPPQVANARKSMGLSYPIHDNPLWQ